LYICKKIAENLRGNIKVTSQIGKGSEFSFYLFLNSFNINIRNEMIEINSNDKDFCKEELHSPLESEREISCEIRSCKNFVENEIMKREVEYISKIGHQSFDFISR